MGITYLLDTHSLLWWLFDDPKLDTTCRTIWYCTVLNEECV